MPHHHERLEHIKVKQSDSRGLDGSGIVQKHPGMCYLPVHWLFRLFFQISTLYSSKQSRRKAPHHQRRLQIDAAAINTYLIV